MIGGLPFAPKPRIVVVSLNPFTSDPYIWICIGIGMPGRGTTPCDAYWDWRSQFERIW